MYLINLLEEIFQDKETPIQLLRKYDLETVLEQALVSVHQVLEKPPVPIHQLVALTPSILIPINSRLRTVLDPVDKKRLEQLIADVSGHLFKKVLDKSDQQATAVKAIKEALETASKINGYNLDTLLGLLNYDHLELKYREDEIYFYDWMGKPHELDDLADKLRRQGIIKSVKEFKELFKNHNNPKLRVQFTKESPAFLTSLFDELKYKGLIIPRGCTGHFHPIKVYGVDFENKVLMKNEPKLIKKNAKKWPEKWQKTENKAKELVAPIMTPITSRSPRAKQQEMSASKI